MIKKPGTTFFLVLLVFSAFLSVCGYSLFAEGMFLDGVTYASISRNLAIGKGSFWHPYFTETLYPRFHEHPPLVFILEGTFFRLAGDHVLSERLYSLFTCILNGYLLALIWRQLKEDRGTIWLPLLLWSLTPLVIWSFSNNMLENTMGIFTTFSAVAYLFSLNSNRFPFLLLSGTSVFLGFLCKGPFALFAWMLPLCMQAGYGDLNSHRFVRDTAYLVLFTCLPLSLLLVASPQAADSLEQYLNTQVINGVLNVQTVSHRWYILLGFVAEISAMAVICLLIFILARTLKIKSVPGKAQFFKAVSWLLFSLSGVLPIMISLKQSKFYFLAAMPFAALAFSMLVSDKAAAITEKLSASPLAKTIVRLTAVTAFILAISIAVIRSHSIRTDREMITLVKRTAKMVPPEAVVGIPGELYQNWPLHSYFSRYARISLSTYDKRGFEFYLTLKALKQEGELSGRYRAIMSQGPYVLYKKTGESPGN